MNRNSQSKMNVIGVGTAGITLIRKLKIRYPKVKYFGIDTKGPWNRPNHSLINIVFKREVGIYKEVQNLEHNLKFEVVLFPSSMEVLEHNWLSNFSSIEPLFHLKEASIVVAGIGRMGGYISYKLMKEFLKNSEFNPILFAITPFSFEGSQSNNIQYSLLTELLNSGVHVELLNNSDLIADYPNTSLSEKFKISDEKIIERIGHFIPA